MGNFFTDKISLIFPHYISTVVSPPGKINRSKGTPILIPSLMRSGTHLLIDLILNNFKLYKSKPLYIDLDRYVSQGKCIDDLLNCGNYIIKTHYPQLITNNDIEKIISEIALNSKLISPKRELKSIYKSFCKFGYEGKLSEFRDVYENFMNYWNNYDNINFIRYDDMINRTEVSKLLIEISNILNIPKNKKIIYPPSRNQKFFVYVIKFLTRLLGNKCPIVNTTITFAEK